MITKIMVISTLLISLVLLFNLTLTSAQRYNKESEYVLKDDFALIEERIDRILSMLPEKGRQESANQEISAKLDQVLANQQRILAELDVVKVRATRK